VASDGDGDGDGNGNGDGDSGSNGDRSTSAVTPYASSAGYREPVYLCPGESSQPLSEPSEPSATAVALGGGRAAGTPYMPRD